jgi:hypothetical protein
VDPSASKASHHLDYCRAGGNPLPPDLMTADKRLSEVAQILAAGLMRLRHQGSRSEPSRLEKNSLDFSPARSLHATTAKRRKVAR